MNPTAAGPAVGSAGRPQRALPAPPALVLQLLGGLALRVTIAYVIFPGSGFESDLGTYASWSLTLADHGPMGFYASAGFADYPPAYLYVLWPIGLLAEALGSGNAGGLASGLIKLPPMLMDIAVGYLLYRLVLGWTWPGRRAEALALGAAALYVFNPVTLYDSALWGQTDAAGALVMLLCAAALIRGNAEGATALAVLAAMVKPQFGIVMIPLVGVVLLRRHLFRAGSGPRHAPWGPAALRGWLAREQGPLRIVTAVLLGVAVFFVLALPFQLGPVEYLQLMGRTAEGYAYVTVNAYNPWALLGTDSNPSLAEAWAWSPDTIALVGPFLLGSVEVAVTIFTVGALLLVLGFLWGVIRAGMTGDRWTILLAAAFLSMAFFILPTRVHERYLFPVFAFLPLLAVADRRWLVSLVVIAVGSFINLHGILMIPAYATGNIEGLPLGDLFMPGNFPFVLLAIVLQTGVFVFAAWELRGQRLPDPFELAAGEVAGAVGRVPVPDGARAVGGMGAATAEADTEGWSPAGAGMPDLVPVVPAGPTVRERIAARVFSPRIRRDRSASLAMERGGRLTPRDLGVMASIFVAARELRGFNLAQPFDMYFDEVYHARTGMEFLQHWKYGERHSIYEYTHPHLAKYTMAWSVDTFAENKVTGTGTVGATGVTAAAVEMRWSPFGQPSVRNGDRLFAATATGVAVFDLRGDDREATIAADALALAVNDGSVDHALYLAGPDRVVSRVDTTLLDARRADKALPEPAPQVLGQLPGTGQVTALAIAGDHLVALLDDETLAAIELPGRDEDGDLVFDPAPAVAGPVTVDGAVALTTLPAEMRLVARPAEIEDASAVALLLADQLFDDADRIGALLASDTELVVIAGYLDDPTERTIGESIDDGTLTGISLESGPAVAVAGTAGAVLLDAATLAELEVVDVGGPATGVGLNEGLDDPVLYVSGVTSVRGFKLQSGGPASRGTIRMPGVSSTVLWNEPANLVHVLGRTADGRSTVYVIEPHGDSLFADAALPFEPVAVVLDTQPERPGDDRTQLIAIAADGRTASVEVGSNAFAWRLPGVVLGAATAALMYLLARILFRRRAVAVFTGLIALAEGMLFANSRIAMNDVYVTFFVVAALTLFVGLWLGRWQRAWQVIVGFVAIGLLLGLALAAKWVAAYAIGGMALLILLRSALGRLIALTGLLAITAVLGAAAIRPADVEDPARNWLFLLMMVGLTLALAAAMVRRPVRFTLGELVVAVAVPAVLGGFLAVAGVLFGGLLPAGASLSGGQVVLVGAAMLVGSAAIHAIAWVGGRAGIGPRARRMPLDSDAPVPAPPADGWLRPGGLRVFAWLFALGCLTVIPTAVYVASYIPWANLGNQLWAGVPAGNTGQTLWQLTLSMYDYHDNLRATHAASSPWWAWLLDLKPVWFYQEGFANDTTGVIYDSGNLVVFWLGIAAMGFCAWAAWTRRSPALTAIVIMFCAMWLPWARIDRATFQYHVYTSLPFIVLALGYLLAELWHGPSRVGWTLARVAGALAMVGAPLLWLLRKPLCAISGVESVNPGGQACGDTVSRTLPLSEQGFAAVLVLLVGAGVILWLLWKGGAGRFSADLDSVSPRRVARHIGWAVAFGLPGLLVSRAGRHRDPAILLALGGTVVGLLAVWLLLDDQPTTELQVGSEYLALAALLLLAIPAVMALRARDPRRFAAGMVLAAIVFFVAWYPNLAGLPLPSDFANVYQGLLPTWNYAFQFAVNTDPPVEGSMVDSITVAVGVVTVILGLITMILARYWGPAHPNRSSAVSEGA